jgi:NAD(P)-dependent dehydrogenase (short-subunit alcohol dehydrogenase family)
MQRLAGKIAIVTGGASGIGRGCARALATEGAAVIVADVDDSGSRETCDFIGAAGGVARAHVLDVTDERHWKAVIELARNVFGRLDILVNNAGICISKPILEMSLSMWRRQLAINLDGVFLGAQAAMPLMTTSGGGSIVNISSVAGLKGVAGMTGYCASKGGVRLFTKALALECAQARNSIRVNSVHPGAIETPIWLKLGNDGALPEHSAGANEDVMAQIRAAGEQATPLGHTGVPADIAAGVVFLASDESRFITGTELIIDGGVMAG